MLRLGLRLGLGLVGLGLELGLGLKRWIGFGLGLLLGPALSKSGSGIWAPNSLSLDHISRETRFPYMVQT